MVIVLVTHDMAYGNRSRPYIHILIKSCFIHDILSGLARSDV